MSKKPTGGPAFPRTGVSDFGDVQAGMSLRDAFAMNIDIENLTNVGDETNDFAEALCGVTPNSGSEPEAYLAWLARLEARIRYAKADAMLAEREKP